MNLNIRHVVHVDIPPRVPEPTPEVKLAAIDHAAQALSRVVVICQDLPAPTMAAVLEGMMGLCGAGTALRSGTASG